MFDLIHQGGCHDSFVYFDYITDRGQGDTFVVVLIVLCFGVELLCYLHLMYVFIFF